MDVLIESTQHFEQDLTKLSAADKAAAIEKVNNCAALLPIELIAAQDQLRQLPLAATLNGYDSSLYVLKVSPNVSIILAVDDDPIFEQIIVTLFRAIDPNHLDKAYQEVAESLYQEIPRTRRETVPIP